MIGRGARNLEVRYVHRVDSDWAIDEYVIDAGPGVASEQGLLRPLIGDLGLGVTKPAAQLSIDSRSRESVEIAEQNRGSAAFWMSKPIRPQ